MSDIEKLTELVYRAMPYPHQVKNLKFEESAIRFNWRGTTFRVNSLYGVDEVGDGVLIGSDKAILVAALIANASTREPRHD